MEIIFYLKKMPFFKKYIGHKSFYLYKFLLTVVIQVIIKTSTKIVLEN